MMVCDKCNKELDDNAEFCDNCATLLVKDEVDTKEVTKKKSLFIPALLGVGFLFLVMSVSVFLFVNTKSKKNADESIEKFVYIKDNELFVSSFAWCRVFVFGYVSFSVFICKYKVKKKC